jgi:trigger factor
MIGETLLKVSSEKIENSQMVLNIELEPEVVEKGLDSAYRKIVNRVNIPGFRKGKAPRYMVERMVGREAIFEEAARELVPTAYEEAIKQENIDAYAEPDIEIVDFEPMVFKATVPLPPKVELGNYNSIRLQKEVVNVTDEDVEAALNARREQQAVWEEPAEERGAEKGDQLTVNIEMWKNDEMVGDKAESQNVILGDTPLYPGIEEQLIGAKAGEPKEAKVTLPEDYPLADAAGQEVTFKMSITGIKEKHLPELDDEFAKTVGETETLAELREKLKGNLTRSAKMRADERFEDLVVRTVADQATIEMPPVMVERELDRLISEYEQSLRAQQVTLEQYLTYGGRTIEEFREQLKPRGEQRVRTALVLNAIREAENISVTEEDINTEADRLAEEIGEGGEQVKQRLEIPQARAAFRNNILEERIIKRLEDIVTQPEEPAGETPAPEEPAAAEPETAEVSADVQPEEEAGNKEVDTTDAGDTTDK